MTGSSTRWRCSRARPLGLGVLAVVLAFTGLPARDPSKPPLLRSVVGGRPR